MLRTMLFAGAALHTFAKIRGILSEGSYLDVFKNSAKPSVHMRLIVTTKSGGNIYAVRTGHTIAASRTANP